MYENCWPSPQNFKVTLTCGHEIHIYPAPFKDDILFCLGCENGQVVKNVEKSALGAGRKVY